ncbi:MAG: hypothetical protein ACREE3_01150 [Stellaceae bacterium]
MFPRLAAMRFPRLATATLLAAALSTASSGVASAASQMPQMDFADPLTLSQVGWMAVIMIVLYILMARWALPRIGSVIENRKRRIADDLEVALEARTEATRVASEFDQAIRRAHDEGLAKIASMMADAKDKNRAEAETLHARLEADLARAKGEIEQSRRAAVSVIRPVVEDVTRALVERLTGRPAEQAAIDQAVDAAQR